LIAVQIDLVRKQACFAGHGGFHETIDGASVSWSGRDLVDVEG